MQRRKRATITGQLAQQLSQRTSDSTKDTGSGVQGAPHKARLVPCVRHEERDFNLGPKPCLLSSTLQGDIQEGSLLRVMSRQQPELRFYARAHADAFVTSASVKGISILRQIAETAKLTDKEVELQEVREEDAKLGQMVMVISDLYMSKRDIWHMHLDMMKERGRLIYRGFSQNLHEHVLNSRIEKVLGADGKELFGGLVTEKTEVTFRSSSSNLFLLIEVSAELFTFGLAGRPYWEILLECFGQLIEKSLMQRGSSVGHYVHMVLFARAEPSVQKGPRTPKTPHKGHEYFARGPPEGTEDYYEVFFEGFARALPPTQQLLEKVRQVFVTLVEQENLYKDCPERWQRESSGLDSEASGARTRSSSVWQSLRAGELVKAPVGNLLESLNLALDQFDQHHLDRLLKVSGQTIVVLTAGSGLIETKQKELYLLTHQRCISAGHDGFQIISVREPPLHRVPWVVWPGGPAPGQPQSGSVDGNAAQLAALKLSPFPPWMSCVSYPEVSFCPCTPGVQGVDWVRSSLLPLANATIQDRGLLHVPSWNADQCNLSSDRKVVSAASEGRSPEKKPPAAQADQKVWDLIRLPRLRSYFKRESEAGFEKREYGAEYPVQPTRFCDGSNEELEKLYLMYDLVGLRLAALGGTQLCSQDSDRLPLTAFANTPKKHQGSYLPSTMQCLSVAAACGSQWNLEPREEGLMISSKRVQTEIPRRDKAASYLYNTFFVVGAPNGSNGMGWIESRRVFHMQQLLEWSELDQIVAGVYPIPPALPYPVERKSDHGGKDNCPGWKLRGALKQHMFVLIPESEPARSHREIFRCALKILEGKMPIGKDLFEVFEDNGDLSGLEKLIAKLKKPELTAVQSTSAEASTVHEHEQRDAVVEKAQPCEAAGVAGAKQNIDEADDAKMEHTADVGEHLPEGQERSESWEEISRRTISQFRVFKARLEELCFGAASSKEDNSGKRQSDDKHLDIDTAAKSFYVRRQQSQVKVRQSNFPSSFAQSRDWFQLFYDDNFCPPKFFHLVVEWIACSSIHMVNFETKLARLAEESGFRLVPLPIAQLFPQPAPPWVWGDDQETNFDRLALYPRIKIRLPPLSGLTKEQAYAALLQEWLDPPLNLLFIFSSPILDFKVTAPPDAHDADAQQRRAQYQLHQRLKGWVLCSSDGLCLVALREDCIYWYENRLLLLETRDAQKCHQFSQQAAELRETFFGVTNRLLTSWTADSNDGEGRDFKIDLSRAWPHRKTATSSFQKQTSI
eukprot:TRINITY_DN106528_c0_g1_i1.p1 TRINITY_DN106528_c0_g1~~TRINITY_DN106528_c0_g1_i1.p1  ORF type:complete len:1275 (+),score=282.41 TRINITY_DN106528_c0_g1_i1:79-3825(+)